MIPAIHSEEQSIGARMSRNIVIVKADGNFRSFNEAAEDEHLLSLGARDAVIAGL